MSKQEIRVDEWLVALRQSLAKQKGESRGISVREMMAATGHCRDWVMDRLQPLVASGQWVADREWRQDMSGRTMPVPVYRPVKKGKKC